MARRAPDDAAACALVGPTGRAVQHFPDNRIDLERPGGDRVRATFPGMVRYDATFVTSEGTTRSEAWNKPCSSAANRARAARGRATLASAGHSSATFRRAALVCPRLTFESTRRRCEPRVGVVGRRGGAADAALSINARSRASASSRFLS